MKYNNNLAVAYAKKYALTPNKEYHFINPKKDDIGDDCANFISQCLYAGGCPLLYSPYPWFYKKLNHHPFYSASLNWTVAHSLYWFLKSNGEINGYGVKAKEIKDISKLVLGDLIFFADLNNHVFHSSIITKFTDEGIPLISQHSYNKLDTPIREEYYKLNIHYLKIFL
ncbi:Putative amidase domain-containing protein [Clostridium cavendishii DSM 21758]|uniref:Putative amidase domain-containing protein n=1 Tax=Clostridium cavendishii DSM 21758 TaxID=1121302 RepID=A0A1M6CWB5_9CLOT|nr:amidase domain-containing protein [Clostridium cavendishii]SHI65104.1 Putative amidase domain-containing protein [Clostridium cavendishii DSM 21758]